MEIQDIIQLIKDNKVNIEIIEKRSGASFGMYNMNYVPLELLNKKVIEINTQYFEGKRILILKF